MKIELFELNRWHMKKLYLPLLFLVMTTTSVVAQDRFSSDFEPIRKDLTSWDPIRGAWLASSLEAMAKQLPIPDRTFPEDFTPAEMFRVVPAQNRDFVREHVQNNQRVATNQSTTIPEWDRLNNIVSRPNCRPLTGRSYGDPHLVSFDGASYSFQTVGEFVLARSNNGDFEVQTRQRPQSENFSLNTAVAMRVAGDRVTIYASDHPDAFTNEPVRVNGTPVRINSGTYYLPHGGTIRPTGDTYLVTWPTGETSNVQIRRSGSMPFMNVTVSVFPCAGNYDGLLGNANGRESDDFDRAGRNSPTMMAFSTFGNSSLQQGSDAAEKEYLAFLARDFARDWRITQETSLFDYGFGQSTLAFTDVTFPRVHYTVGDLSNDRRDVARRNCENAGVPAAELRGCIFDQGHLNLPPNPRPEIKDPTVGFKPTRLEKPVLNVNPRPEPLAPNTNGTVEQPAKGTIHPDLMEKPAKIENPEVKKPVKETIHPDLLEKPEVNKPQKETIKPQSSQPVNNTPKPEVKPTIKPEKPAGSGVKPSGGLPKSPAPVAPKPPAPVRTIKTGKG